mmetsp:Transcript_40610/g.87176  ORF Transcript_40610/g.87176 Transcript_40610/m.87176 type:complete len:263 (+) Transcript_40610:381-1169(+)
MLPFVFWSICFIGSRCCCRGRGPCRKACWGIVACRASWLGRLRLPWRVRVWVRLSVGLLVGIFVIWPRWLWVRSPTFVKWWSKGRARYWRQQPSVYQSLALLLQLVEGHLLLLLLPVIPWLLSAQQCIPDLFGRCSGCCCSSTFSPVSSRLCPGWRISACTLGPATAEESQGCTGETLLVTSETPTVRRPAGGVAQTRAICLQGLADCRGQNRMGIAYVDVSREDQEDDQTDPSSLCTPSGTSLPPVFRVRAIADWLPFQSV